MTWALRHEQDGGMQAEASRHVSGRTRRRVTRAHRVVELRDRRRRADDHEHQHAGADRAARRERLASTTARRRHSVG